MNSIEELKKIAKAHEYWESLQEGTEPDYDAEDAFLKDLAALGEE